MERRSSLAGTRMPARASHLRWPALGAYLGMVAVALRLGNSGPRSLLVAAAVITIGLAIATLSLGQPSTATKGAATFSLLVGFLVLRFTYGQGVIGAIVVAFTSTGIILALLALKRRRSGS